MRTRLLEVCSFKKAINLAVLTGKSESLAEKSYASEIDYQFLEGFEKRISGSAGRIV